MMGAAFPLAHYPHDGRCIRHELVAITAGLAGPPTPEITSPEKNPRPRTETSWLFAYLGNAAVHFVLSVGTGQKLSENHNQK